MTTVDQHSLEGKSEDWNCQGARTPSRNELQLSRWWTIRFHNKEVGVTVGRRHCRNDTRLRNWSRDNLEPRAWLGYVWHKGTIWSQWGRQQRGQHWRTVRVRGWNEERNQQRGWGKKKMSQHHGSGGNTGGRGHLRKRKESQKQETTIPKGIHLISSPWNPSDPRLIKNQTKPLLQSCSYDRE